MEASLFCIHLKKRQLKVFVFRLKLVLVLVLHAPSISTRFRRFKSDDFDTEDNERPDKPDEELKAFLNENRYQMLQKLAVS